MNLGLSFFDRIASIGFYPLECLLFCLPARSLEKYLLLSFESYPGYATSTSYWEISFRLVAPRCLFALANLITPTLELCFYTISAWFLYFSSTRYFISFHMDSSVPYEFRSLYTLSADSLYTSAVEEQHTTSNWEGSLTKLSRHTISYWPKWSRLIYCPTAL